METDVKKTKKSKKALLIAIPVVIVVAIAIYAAVNISGRGITATTLEGQVAQVIQNNGCLQCHAEVPTDPWYANFPVISGVIDIDQRNANRFIDLENVVNQLNSGAQVSQVDVAKLEQSTLNGDMPIAKYKFVHWGSNLNAKERKIITDWVAQNRSTYAYTDLAAPEFANEPIQPIPDVESVVKNLDQDKIQLGLKLYHDTRLSDDSTVSCATCHPLDRVGQDNSPHAKGIGGQLGGISAPSTYNATFNIQQFWNGRAADLQAQAGGPPANPVEMGNGFDTIVEILSKDEAMVAEFQKIYGAEGITENSITDAIAEFEKTLVTPNSRFDKYLKGDTTALTAEEIQGYELFKSNTCATCHVGPSMGGQSFEFLGVVKPSETYYAARGTEISGDDQGLYGFTGDEKDMYKFKVPNLRNIELTAPYMHDGSAYTLEEAVRNMFTYNTATPNPSADTVNKIVAFLKTLTGENDYMTYKYVPSNPLR